MKYNLTIVRPEGFLHSQAFTEVADSLGWALSQLGHEVSLTQNWFSENQEQNIIFGAELIADHQRLPPGSIVYNLEQTSHPNMPKVRALVERSKARVWDYSLRNCDEWVKLKIDYEHVPIGYTPNLTRIPKAEVQDIDVLFYGWLTPRRVSILEQLKATGLKVHATASCYGGARDNLISRSKVVLNVHHDGRDMFEIVRCSYLMANSKCIVSEESVDDAEHGWIKDGILRCNYRLIIDLVKSYVEADAITRGIVEGKAIQSVRHSDYVATVARAIDPIAPIQKKLDQASDMMYRKSVERDFGILKNPIIQGRYDSNYQSGDMKDFLPWIRKHAKGQILEIGTRDGASTSAFLLGLEEHGGHLTSVDVNDCSGLWTHSQWKFIQASSADLKIADNSFDIALIDGDHRRDAFIGDLYNCFYWVRPGGMILVHDIQPERGHEFYSVGIREEYFKFIESKGLRHEELPGKYGMGVIYL